MSKKKPSAEPVSATGKPVVERCINCGGGLGCDRSCVICMNHVFKRVTELRAEAERLKKAMSTLVVASGSRWCFVSHNGIPMEMSAKQRKPVTAALGAANAAREEKTDD